MVLRLSKRSVDEWVRRGFFENGFVDPTPARREREGENTNRASERGGTNTQKSGQKKEKQRLYDTERIATYVALSCCSSRSYWSR
jgi:hypothetical protein